MRTAAPAGMLSLAMLVSLAASSPASAYPLFNLFDVTQIAERAVLGLNVPQPVPGFELVLFKDGRQIYRRAFGNWQRDQVANADSATKTLSGALILSLADRAAAPFSLNTRLSEFNPAFSGAKSSITIRQCFSHTAGFGDSNAVANPFITLQQAGTQIAGEPLAYSPGTTFSYGGTSMQAAGSVAELAGGKSWDALFDERLVQPLGLQVTRYVLTSPANPRIAGGCESTAMEFARFMEMLRSDGVFNGQRVLSHHAITQMFTRQTPGDVVIANSPVDDSADYGVGIWLDQRLPDGTLVGAQAAGARGFSSWIDFDDGVVGAFATDLTSGQNVRELINMFRDAAQESVRNPRPCPADFNADGFLDFRDMDDFIYSFESGDPSSDYNDDGFLTFEDYDAFIESFRSGC